LSLGQDLVPSSQCGDAVGSRVQTLVPSLAPLRQGTHTHGCAWCLAAAGGGQLCGSLSKCPGVSVFLGTFKLHENDFRKQKHVLLAKYCVKCPENRSGEQETFTGRVEEEGNSCVVCTALKQHFSQLTMYLNLSAS